MMQRHSALQRKAPLRASKPMKRGRGMKGRTRNASEKRFHDLLCSVVGCIACRKDGRPHDWQSCLIHHIDGRTKPWAHWLVLPLCAGHHQDGTGAAGLIAVHPWRTRFEEAYGCQENLLADCLDILLEAGAALPEGLFVAAKLAHPEGRKTA